MKKKSIAQIALEMLERGLLDKYMLMKEAGCTLKRGQRALTELEQEGSCHVVEWNRQKMNRLDTMGRAVVTREFAIYALGYGVSVPRRKNIGGKKAISPDLAAAKHRIAMLKPFTGDPFINCVMQQCLGDR